jgi:tetratricopeptide (TPR) repeat protein
MMPARPRSHEHDELARRKYEALLPPSWTHSPAHSREYGIDGVTEIFRDQRATGLQYNVQLKGTDADDHNRVLARRIKTTTWQYWQSLDSPVLVVVYESQSDTVFTAWAHRFEPEVEPNQQTLTLRLKDEDRWFPSRIREIEEEVAWVRRWRRGEYGLPVPVYVSAEPSERHLLPAIRLGLGPSTAFVDLRLGAAPPGAVSLAIDKAGLAARVGEVSGPRVERRPAELGDRLPHAVGVVLGTALARVGASALAIQVLQHHADRSGLIDDPVLLAELMGVCVANHRTDILAQAFVTTVEQTLHSGLDVPLQFLMMVPPYSDSELGLIERALRAKLHIEQVSEGGPSRSDEAALHYSFANLLQSRGKWNEAIAEYRLAAKWDNAYALRSYWKRELAACLFETEQYDEAASHYRAALAGDSDPGLLARLGDVEMHRGRYTIARDLFLQYELNTPSVEGHWFIARLLVEEILRTVRLEVQDRRPCTSSPKLKEHENLSAGDGVRLLRQDALCHEAWVAISRARYETGLSTVLRADIAAAATKKDCPVCWARAVLTAASQGDMDLVFVLFETGYFFLGDELLVDINQFHPGFVSFADRLASEVRTGRGGRQVTLRMRNQDGTHDEAFMIFQR